MPRPMKSETAERSVSPEDDKRRMEKKYQEEKAERKKAKPEDVWVERVGHKLIKKTKVNGNLYSVYLGNWQKDASLLKKFEKLIRKT